MPLEHETTLNIACDNPNCPGNSLDPGDRTGWMFVTTEVYGEPTQSHVYCCADCAGADAPASFNTPEDMKLPQPTPPELAQQPEQEQKPVTAR